MNQCTARQIAVAAVTGSHVRSDAAMLAGGVWRGAPSVQARSISPPPGPVSFCNMSPRYQRELTPRKAECPGQVAPGRRLLFPPVNSRAIGPRRHRDERRRASPGQGHRCSGSASRRFSSRLPRIAPPYPRRTRSAHNADVRWRPCSTPDSKRDIFSQPTSAPPPPDSLPPILHLSTARVSQPRLPLDSRSEEHTSELQSLTNLV